MCEGFSMTHLGVLYSFISELYCNCHWMNHRTWWLVASFLPYIWFAAFKVQFNGNVLSGWKITSCYCVAMYIWNRTDGNGNISHTFYLCLCQKCQPFLLCQITTGRMQLQAGERRGTKPLQWALGRSQGGGAWISTPTEVRLVLPKPG